MIDFSKPFMTLGISILYRVHLVNSHLQPSCLLLLLTCLSPVTHLLHTCRTPVTHLSHLLILLNCAGICLMAPSCGRPD